MVTLTNINDPREVGQAKQREQSRRILTAPTSNETNGKAPINAEAAKNIVTYYNTLLATYISSFNIRPQMLQRDLAYYREQDNTRAQAVQPNWRYQQGAECNYSHCDATSGICACLPH